MTAQLVDFAAARRARGIESVEDVAARHVVEVERYLADARERLLAETRSLPGPFAAAALLEILSVTEFDPDDYWTDLNPPRLVVGATRLGAFNECRRYDVTTGTVDGKRVGEPWTYEENCRGALSALRAAIGDLRKAEREPGRRRVAARRRMLTAAKRHLLRVLFRFGRRRIDFDELEWHTDWDGRCTYTRRREPRQRA